MWGGYAATEPPHRGNSAPPVRGKQSSDPVTRDSGPAPAAMGLASVPVRGNVAFEEGVRVGSLVVGGSVGLDGARASRVVPATT